jgi:hypothetical protein
MVSFSKACVFRRRKVKIRRHEGFSPPACPAPNNIFIGRIRFGALDENFRDLEIIPYSRLDRHSGGWSPGSVTNIGIT